MSGDHAVIFPLLYLGPLPPYFPFWARSCVHAGSGFRWIVYNDHVSSAARINDQVSVIPYRWEDLAQDYRTKLGVNLHPRPERKKVLELRAFLYFLRRDQDGLTDYPFWGLTDVDMVYGNLSAFLPGDREQYGMISAHDGRPCGPFTLIRREASDAILSVPRLRERLADPVYHLLEESPEISDAIRPRFPIHGQEVRLQPWRDPRMNLAAVRGIWTPDGVQVSDGRLTLPAAFFHFSKQKRRSTFSVHSPSLTHDCWLIDESGIWSPDYPLRAMRSRLVKSAFRMRSLARPRAS